MPTARSRDRRRGRGADDAGHDPTCTEAYEQSWYALLARHASGERDGTDPIAGESSSDPEPDPEPVPKVEAEDPGPPLATVTKLVVAVEPPPDPLPASAAQPATVRIGVRRLEDPGAVYLRYLTASPHRDFFRGKLWPSSPTITPVHLWRANHLGAGWDLELVERFMDGAASSADALIASAPRSAPAGSAERRAWIDAFLSAAWVREFGVARVSKTVFATLPDLVPDLDPRLMTWARARWLGVPESEDEDETGRCLETWELLEDVLVLRGRELGRVSRGLRRLTPALAPVGSLGLILAAFWDDLRTEVAPARVPRIPSRRGASRASAPATPPSTAKANRRAKPKTAPAGRSVSSS